MLVEYHHALRKADIFFPLSYLAVVPHLRNSGCLAAAVRLPGVFLLSFERVLSSSFVINRCVCQVMIRPLSHVANPR